MAIVEGNGFNNKKWYESLFEGFLSVISYCRVLYDEQGTVDDLIFLEVNNNFGPLTGLEDPVGKRWTEIAPGNSKEAQRNLFKVFERVVATGTPEKHELFNPNRNRWYGISVYPIEGDHIAIVFDVITEQKFAQAALKESEKRYRQLFNSIVTEFILLEAVYDDNGEVADFRVLELNPAFEKFSGNTAETFIGKTLRELAGPRAKYYIDTMVGVVTSGESKNFESYIETLDKYMTHTAYLPKPGHVAVLSLDITERKKAEEEKRTLEARLQQSYKMEAIGSLAGGIAHDFNNILSAIIGYSDLARYKVDGGEPLKNELQEIYNAGIRARELVRQILTFSRQTEIVREPMDVIPLFKESLKFLRASLPVTIKIESRFPDHSCTIMADATQMHQLIMNLCTNAAHAMKENGGMLEVSLKKVLLDDVGKTEFKLLKPGHCLRINVSDTGCGIADDLIHRIFDPFFTTKQRGEGTGMGLSVVHGIVNDMGGAISVGSFPGQGSTFNIFLPLLDQESVQADQTRPIVQTGSGTILLVDDEEGIIDSSREILQHLGYTVCSTTRVPEALEMFRQNPGRFDLVLTDLTMPAMTGLELAEQLQTIRPGIPVVLSTGYGLELSPQRQAQAGICAMVFKPVSISELGAVVHKALNPT